MRTKLTIRNYRCFVQPVTVEIGKGFTAFVGVNNAGKSTIMRFLLEFRNLFNFLSDGGNLFNTVKHTQSAFSPIHILDKEELFSNLNENGIQFSLEFLPEEGDENDPLLLRKIVFDIKRDLKYKAEVYIGEEKTAAITDSWSGDSPWCHNGNIMVKVHNALQVFKLISNTLYIGPFRNTINVGTKSDYLDIQIGESFIKRFRALKTGPSKSENTAMTRLTNDIRKIFEFNSLNIEPSDDDRSLQITINEKPYKQHELGSGLSQFIVVLANASIKKPKYILIDEPELNLHPSLQLDFLTALGGYAEEGVWFSTHSVGLARSSAERVYSVIKEKDGDSTVRLLEGTPRLAEFLGEMSFSSHKELGFEKILLVEGPTEVKTFQQFLRKMNKDHKIVLLPLHGRINEKISEELEEILRITPKVSALIDSEKKSEKDEISKERKDFVALCNSKNIPIHVLEYRATENYFTNEVVKTVFGSEYKSLRPYEKLSEINPSWSKNQNWKLASATSLDIIKDKDLGGFLESL